MVERANQEAAGLSRRSGRIPALPYPPIKPVPTEKFIGAPWSSLWRCCRQTPRLSALEVASDPKSPRLGLTTSECVVAYAFDEHRSGMVSDVVGDLASCGLPAAASPVSVRLDPFPAVGRGRGQRKVENRDRLPLPTPTTNRDDLVSVIEVDTFDADGDAKDCGDEGDGEVLLQHCQEADALFRIAVGIDDRFFNERPKSTPGQPLAGAWAPLLIHLVLHGTTIPGALPLHVSAQPRGVSCAISRCG
jgi:hypothetical protein